MQPLTHVLLSPFVNNDIQAMMKHMQDPELSKVFMKMQNLLMPMMTQGGANQQQPPK
jgi:hypothetical protein